MRSSSATIERARPLLGTIVVIRATGSDAGVLQSAVDAAFETMRDVEQRMSFHHPTSELSKLNRFAHVAPQRVHATTFRVLQAALALARASEGLFDPSIGARLAASGHLPAPDSGEPPIDATWRDVELLSGQRVAFRKRAWLDLGGIAKGYAVDRAARVLQAAGVEHALVNAGGDLRAFGNIAETIAVRDPADPASSRPLLELHDGAVATSAGYFSADDASMTALVDTRDGARLGIRRSVSVCAPRAIWADGLTKVVLADEAKAAPLLRRLHAQALVLDANGDMRILAA